MFIIKVIALSAITSFLFSTNRKRTLLWNKEWFSVHSGYLSLHSYFFD